MLTVGTERVSQTGLQLEGKAGVGGAAGSYPPPLAIWRSTGEDGVASEDTWAVWAAGAGWI